MLNKLLRYPKIALLNTGNKDFFGYKLLLDQEKIPYNIVNTLKGKWDLAILPINNNLPIQDLLDFVKNGGKILASYDMDIDKGLAITDKINTFQPFGSGIIYYCSTPMGEELVKTEYYAPSTERRIIFQWFNQNLLAIEIRNQKRKIRMDFKHILYKLIGPITQIWYWPDFYQSCFCQRVDVDFPIKLPFNKGKIINQLNYIVNNFKDINFSLFLNYSFPKENKKIEKLFKSATNIEFQSHGCNKKIKHRDLCYSLNSLLPEEITNMLTETVINKKAIIFAPPCEHVNGLVLNCAEELGIKFITAGGIAKDDIPRKCFFDHPEYGVINREFSMINIPTSEKEFDPNPSYNLDMYNLAFDKTISDNSLFCIYFHPDILLNKKKKRQLSDFFYYVLKNKKEKNIWFPFMSELATWWYYRDKVDIQDGNISYRDNDTKTFFSQNKNLKLSIIKWSPGKITKLI